MIGLVLRSIRIVVSVLFFLIATGSATYGQIITDSQKKLKTETKDRDPDRGLFKRKKSSASKPLQSSKRVEPRSSSGSPFSSFNKRAQVKPRTPRNPWKPSFLDKLYPSEPPIYYRYSRGNPYADQKNKTSPRFSAGIPYRSGKRQAVSPRYSSKNSWKPNFLDRLYPSEPLLYYRNSRGNPYAGQKYTIAPRYSAGIPFRDGKRKEVNPRYSPKNPWKPSFLDKLYPSEPPIYYRYSRGNPYAGQKYTIAPRYSAGIPFRDGKRKEVNPRYSPKNPWKPTFLERIYPTEPPLYYRYSRANPDRNKRQEVFPRYSAGSPYVNGRLVIRPKYSTGKDRFDVDEKQKQQNRPYNLYTSTYRGNDNRLKKGAQLKDDKKSAAKISGYKGSAMLPRYSPQQNAAASNFSGNFKRMLLYERDMHPSSNYRFATNDSKWVREQKRKWNLFLTRTEKNKDQPAAVTDTVLKPKFDKKEAKIWND